MLARRSVQGLLDQSTLYLSQSQSQSLVDRLITRNRDAIEAEWELIILAALASLGKVEHEPDLGGASRLDVRFRSTLDHFIADVRTISDENYHRENPVQDFSSELSRLAEKLRGEGIQGGFYYRVNGVSGSIWEKQFKTKLTLPRTHEFKRKIFNKEFLEFIAAIRREPDKRHTFVVDKKEASLSVTFTPREGGFQSGSHLAYNVAHDVVHNVVWRALREKSAQIKLAGPRASGELAGVILCDGDCGILRGLPNAHTLTVENIIRRFLQKSTTVDFVTVVDVCESTAYGHTPPPRFEARSWSIREKAWAQAFTVRFNSALQGLPPPRDSAINTLNHFKYAGDKHHLYGRYKRSSTMTHNSIEVSLRAVLDYLTGRIDRPQFESIVHLDWLALLQKRLDQGRAIESIAMKRSPGEDDDGFVITFGGHDAARAPFQAPPSH